MRIELQDTRAGQIAVAWMPAAIRSVWFESVADLDHGQHHSSGKGMRVAVTCCACALNDPELVPCWTVEWDGVARLEGKLSVGWAERILEISLQTIDRAGVIRLTDSRLRSQALVWLRVRARRGQNKTNRCRHCSSQHFFSPVVKWNRVLCNGTGRLYRAPADQTANWRSQFGSTAWLWEIGSGSQDSPVARQTGLLREIKHLATNDFPSTARHAEPWTSTRTPRFVQYSSG